MGQIQINEPVQRTETFEDYGIYGIRSDGAEQQRIQCPECTPHRQPKHQKERDLTVWVKDGTWNCNHCGWGKGMRLKNRAVAASYSPNPAPQQASIHSLNASAPKVYKRIDDDREKEMKEVDAQTLEYFALRGISAATLQKMGVKIFDKNMIGGMKRWYVFPLYVGGTLVNWKYRHNPSPDVKEFSQSTGREQVWMNLNSLADQSYCILTEGEIDLASFVEIGQVPVLSVPEGAPNHEDKDVAKKLSFVDECMPFFAHIEKIYIAVDTDKNGQRLQAELIEKFGRMRCWIVKYPAGCKDANDVLVKHGRDALDKCLIDAKPLPISGILRVADFRPMLEDLYVNGLPEPARTRFTEIDKIFKVYPNIGCLNVITGIPSHGKTVFLDNYLLSLAEGSGLRFGIYSREHRPDFHVARLAEIYAGQRFLPSFAPQMNRDTMTEAVSFIEQHFFHFYDMKDERYFGLKEICELALHLQRSEGIDVLVIDPWNKVEHLKETTDKTEREYIARMLRGLHAFAKKIGLNIWIVAHTRKMGKANDGVNMEMPNAYSIADANEWYAMPDNILLLYRYFYVQQRASTGKSETVFKTLKIKDDFYGSAERYVRLAFDEQCHRFSEVTAETEKQKRAEGAKDRALPISDRDNELDEVPF
jgi:twinkle protein